MLFESSSGYGCTDEQVVLINASQPDNLIFSFIRGQLEVKAAAETHLPRLMTPRGIPVGVLKAGSSFSPSSITLLLNNWKENTGWQLIKPCKYTNITQHRRCVNMLQFNGNQINILKNHYKFRSCQKISHWKMGNQRPFDHFSPVFPLKLIKCNIRPGTTGLKQD